MKTILKRISSGLLVLIMVLSLVLTVLPVKTQAVSLTYNTGTRHDYNAVLSDQALAYYTGNNTWDKLSQLEGGTEDCLDMSSDMFYALNMLMTDTMENSVSYSSLPDYWKYTDASDGSSGTIWFYLDSTDSGAMSREHVWPKSHASFHEKDGGCDLHHLRPSISNINSSRGNLIMGNVQGTSGAKTYTYNGTDVLYRTSTLCEVNDNIKGDVARIFLYVWCRWEEPNLFKDTPNPVIGANDSANDGGKVIESLDTLLQWCEIDPVDSWEMSRNDKVQDVQGNRNVFIDYPEFAWLIFGRDVPSGYNTPSDNGGSASGGSGSTSCTHSWRAATCTAPMTCSKCGATSGSALGHTWVAATCLSPKTCSVCKATEGTTAAHTDKNSDDTCDVCGEDLGTSTPPVGEAGSYVLITSANQFTTGQYVMIADKGYGPGVYSSGWLTAVRPTVSGNTVTDTMDAVWTLTVNGTSVVLTDSNGITVKPKSGNTNGIQNGAYNWAWEFNTSEGTFIFKGIGSDTTTLASNTGSGNQFRAYKNTTVASGNYPYNFKLYKLVEEVHEHSYKEEVTTKPTCTTPGVKTFTCDCGESYTEEIAALGHSYKAVVTAPTCVDGGYTTYTCTACGDKYVADQTEPTGEHTYVDGVCSVCGAEEPVVGPETADDLVFLQAPSLSFQDYIGMQLLANGSLANTYDELYVEAIQIDPVKGATTTKLTGMPYYGVYLLFDQQILSWSMAEEVTLTMYGVKDGVVYVGQSYTASVESLALSMLPKNASNAKVCRILVDMLNYGAAVQTTFNHNADYLPNTNLGEYANMGTATDPEMSATNSSSGSGSVSILQTSVSMQSKVEIQLAFTGDISAYTAKATIGSKELTCVVDADTYAAYGMTAIRIAIGAANMRDTVTFALYDGETPVTAVQSISVEALVKNLTTSAQGNVILAMMRYGDAVAAFANG
ncbi:MAG: hypothetical protein E7447_04450 [Ruminococcaceae bacterium]|nr:hypothetical protein [Oscillospiraceae bacterium]